MADFENSPNLASRRAPRGAPTRRARGVFPVRLPDIQARRPLADANPVRRRGQRRESVMGSRPRLGIQQGRLHDWLEQVDGCSSREGLWSRWIVGWMFSIAQWTRSGRRSVAFVMQHTVLDVRNVGQQASKDQPSRGGIDVGRSITRHGRRRGCAAKACGGSDGGAITTGAVVCARPAQEGILVPVVMDTCDQNSFGDLWHGWSGSSFLQGHHWVGLEVGLRRCAVR